MEDAKTARRSGTIRVQSALLRLWWMAIGNAILLLSSILIMRPREEFLCAADAVFVCAVVSLLVARYGDLRLHVERSAGVEPAMPGRWKRYVVLVLLLAAAVWVGAHLVGHFRLLPI